MSASMHKRVDQLHASRELKSVLSDMVAEMLRQQKLLGELENAIAELELAATTPDADKAVPYVLAEPVEPEPVEPEAEPATEEEAKVVQNERDLANLVGDEGT
jgi:hypothetical protein